MLYLLHMEKLPFDVIIHDILKLVFPFNSVLFLTSIYFYNFQQKYYELLGCSDKASKNFIHILINMNMNKTSKIKIGLRDLYSMNNNINFNMISFRSEHLTIHMNKYLELFVNHIKKINPYKKLITRSRIIALIVYNSMDKRYIEYIRTDYINQLLSHQTNKPYRIKLQKHSDNYTNYDEKKKEYNIM